MDRIEKDGPTAGDVHVPASGGGKPKRKRTKLQEVADLAKQARWPAGAPGSKGGQFAPGQMGGGGKAGSGASKYSSFADLFGIGSTFPKGESPAWAAKQEAKPAAPPPGAKPHPALNDKGQPVTIHYPTKPSNASTWTDKNQTATFVPGGATPAALNGVKMAPWTSAPRSESEWANVPGQNPNADHTPFEPTQGKSVGAGVVVMEPDGRVWLTRPTNGFGGYANTFPKGTVEHGLSMQASAIKEAYEETGLQIRITGMLGDYERTTSKARFYLAERVGGTPAAMGWESQAVRLATQKDMAKLLNMAVDHSILADLQADGLFEKAAAPKKSGFNVNQPRWPSGTPLGGQWKAYDAGGLLMPPKLGSANNPAATKKGEALYAMAKAGDVKGVTSAALDHQKKADADAAAGKANYHAKEQAKVAQYAAALVQNLSDLTSSTATADRLTGPMKVSAMTAAGSKPGGSNPGGMYQDSKGNKWLVKGNAQYSNGAVNGATSDDRAKNEVLAARLMLAAGTGAPDMKLVDLEGKHGGAKSGPGSLGVASKWVSGAQGFNVNDASHLAAIRADYAVHAWLGNYDVLGMGFDNTVILNGKAVNIDPGGAILFRAQGLKKDSFGKDASEWESMRATSNEQKKVFGSMTASQLQASASKLAGISDDTIKNLVKTYGPGDDKAKADLANTLIARRDAILAKAGLTTQGKAPLAEAVPTPAPTPPKVQDAVKPAGSGGAPAAPQWKDTAAGVIPKYKALEAKALALHAAGDLKGLEAMAGPKADGTAPWAKMSPNGVMMSAFHANLVSNLKAKQAAAVQDVAAGKATVTGKDGTQWTGDDNGVLQPAAGQKGKALSWDNIEGILQASSAKAKSSDYIGAADNPIKTMLLAAKAGDLSAVQAVTPLNPFQAKVKLKLVDAMQVASAPAPSGAAGPAPKPKGEPVKLSMDEVKQVFLNTNFEQGLGLTSNMQAMQIFAMEGKSGKLSAFGTANSDEVKYKLALKNALAAKKKAQDAKQDVTAASAPGGPKPITDAMLDDLLKDEFGPTAGIHLVKPDSPTGKLFAAAKAGDTAGVVMADMPSQQLQNIQQKLIEAMSVSVSAAAPEAPSVVPKPAAPNWESFKLPEGNQNASSHWNKVQAIKAAFDAGDEKAILSMKFGTNTYNIKQVKIANDALAALGSAHQVFKGQQANSHPALLGGTTQSVPGVPKPPASAPKKPFDPSKITTPPNFQNWNGQGKGLSGVDAVNVANNAAAQKIYDTAVKGDLAAIKTLTYDAVDKNTGQVIGQKAFADGAHPSQHVNSYYQNTLTEVDLQLNPPVIAPIGHKVSAQDWDGGFAHFAPVAHGKAVAAVPKTARAGDYIILGQVRGGIATPAKTNTVIDSAGWKASAIKHYQNAPAAAKDTFSLYVMTSGARALNTALRDGAIETVVQGKTVKQHIADFKSLLMDVPEGSTFVRNMGQSGFGAKPDEKKLKELENFLLNTEKGTVVQEPGFTSSSHGTEILSDNNIQWRFTAGKGVKVYPGWLTANKGEGEGLFPPGQRYMITGSKKVGKTVVVDAILLPTVI